MNLFHATLLLLVIIPVAELRGNKKNEGPETLTLGIRMKDRNEDYLDAVELKRVDRVLANKFLRTWITTDKWKKEFQELKVMKELGEFSFYHNIRQRSAFVLFHKRHELYGVIDVTYFVKGFPIDEAKGGHIIDPQYLHKTNDEPCLMRFSRSINDAAIIRSRRDAKPIVYPELLTVISHDTFTNIERDSAFSRGIATVIHVLTLYNAADMLFSFVRSVNVQLNIAGIVIEGIPNQWDFISQSADAEAYVNATDVHSQISKYFWLRQDQFPRHSYDIITYHTSNILKDNTDDEIAGIMSMVGHYTYMFPPDYHKDRYTALIRDSRGYERFSTIAHEIAHAFGAQHDGIGEYGNYYNARSHGPSIMVSGYILKHCLQWTPQTEKEFEDFFRYSAMHCNLKNYPRSLNLPKPKVIFSVDEQCICYGYKSSSPLSGPLLTEGCNRPLKCVDEHNEVVEVPLPMDGTPCDSRKVCWNKKCTKYLNWNPFRNGNNMGVC